MTVMTTGMVSFFVETALSAVCEDWITAIDRSGCFYRKADVRRVRCGTLD